MVDALSLVDFIAAGGDPRDFNQSPPRSGEESGNRARDLVNQIESGVAIEELDPARIRSLIRRPQVLEGARSAASGAGRDITRFLLLGGDPAEIGRLSQEIITDPDSGASFGLRFFEVLEKLRAPQFAFFNAAKAIQDGQGLTGALAAFGRGSAIALPESFRESIGVDEERTDFVELLEKAGVGELGTFTLPLIGEVTGRGTLGFIGDVVFDPLNLVGIGALTKAGRLGRSVQAARKAGPISKRSRLFQRVEESVGSLSERGGGVTALKSAEEKAGERALLTFGNKILIKGDPVIGLAKAAKTKAGETAIAQGLRKVFVRKTTNEAFNELAFTFEKLQNFRVAAEKTRSLELGKRAKQAGLEPDDLNRVSDIIEKEVSDVIDKRKLADVPRIRTDVMKELGVIDVVGEPFARGQRTQSGKLKPNVFDKVNRLVEERIPRATTSEILEAVDTLEGVSPGLKSLTKELVKDFAGMAEAEQISGVLGSTLEFYFPFLRSQRFSELIGEAGGRGFQVISKGRFRDRLGNAIHRKSVDIEDFNRRLTAIAERQGFNQGIGGEELANLVVRDPILARAIRGVGGARARTAREFFNETATRFGVRLARELDADTLAAGGRDIVQEIPAGFRKAEVGSDALKDVFFDKQIAEYLEGYWKIENRPEGFRTFIEKGWDPLVNWWKSWTLGVWPAYHARNQVGNLFNNWLAGVTPAPLQNAGVTYKLGVYGLARDVSKGKTGKIVTDAGREISFKTVMDQAERLGVIGSGLYGAELPEFMGKLVSGRVPAAFGRGDVSGAIRRTLPEGVSERLIDELAASPAKNALLSLGFLAGRGLENNARMAHFVDRLIKGDSGVNAARSVSRFLFDYTDITNAEQGIKKIIPFYTWTRKNLPLQLESLVSQPIKFSFVEKLKSNLEGEDVPNFPSLPEYIRENVPIRVRKSKDGRDEYFLLNNWLPAADIERIFGPPSQSNLTGIRMAEEVGRMIFPGISRIGELAFNFDVFRGSEIEQFPGQEEEFLGLNVGMRSARVLESFRPLGELNRLAFKTDLPTSSALARFATGAKLFPVDVQEESLNRVFKFRDAVQKLSRQKEKDVTLDVIREIQRLRK